MATKSVGKKYLTIQDLEGNEKGPVWVLNNFNEGGEKAKIVIGIPRSNGNGVDIVRVAKTFIPINVSNQVSRAQLLQSSEFRKAIDNKSLLLVDPEYASVILSTEEGKEESNRIENDNNVNKALLEGNAVVETSEDKPRVSTKLENLCLNALESKDNDSKVKAALMNYGNLTLDECRFVRAKFKSSTVIEQFLKERVRQLKDVAN